MFNSWTDSVKYPDFWEMYFKKINIYNFFSQTELLFSNYVAIKKQMWSKKYYYTLLQLYYSRTQVVYRLMKFPWSTENNTYM